MSRYQHSLGLYHWLVSLEEQARARLGRVQMDKPASSVETGARSAMENLIAQLDHHDQTVCLRAIRGLSKYNEAAAAEALVSQVKNSNLGIRWAATDSLIKMGRNSMKPLLMVLTNDFHSSNLREGARRVLHIFQQNGLLSQEEMAVYYALKRNEPGIEVARRANHALIATEQFTSGASDSSINMPGAHLA